MKWGNSSLYASTAAIMGIRAHFPDGTSEIVEENEAVNSPAGSIPVKYSFEAESYYNSTTEFFQLYNQAAEIPPYIHPGSGIVMEFVGVPCLADR